MTEKEFSDELKKLVEEARKSLEQIKESEKQAHTYRDNIDTISVEMQGYKQLIEEVANEQKKLNQYESPITSFIFYSCRHLLCTEYTIHNHLENR